jgi:ParB-like chromosome segregation protein Spo0J
MELEPRTTAPAHATGAVAFVSLSDVAEDATFRLRDEGDVAALAGSIGRLGQLVPVELRQVPGAADGTPRYQVVAGFRRIAALRMLFRERVLARVHLRLGDEDAWGLALGQALLTEPLDRGALAVLRERLQASGVAPWADDLVDEALVRAPVEPELRERFFEFLSGAALPEAAPAGEEDVAVARAAAAEDEAEPAEPADGADDGEASDDGEAGDDGDDGDDGEVQVTPEELVADLGLRLYEVNADLAVAIEAWSELPPEGRRTIVEQARWIAEVLPLLERDEGEGG